MDRGDRFSGYHRHAKQPQTSYGLNMQGNSLDQNAAVNFRNAMNMMNANSLLRATQQEKKEQKVPHAPAVREQDQYMPIANVIRIMRRILPPHAKISDDAKETIQECVSEYISFITGEANERCQREQRKTITAEDVLWAMGKLGFDDYVEPLTLFINRYRESESDRPLTRDGMLKRNAADHGYPLPAYVPPYAMAPPPQGPYDGTMPMAYYRDPLGSAGSGSSSQNNPPNYDSFGQFKG